MTPTRRPAAAAAVLVTAAAALLLGGCHSGGHHSGARAGYRPPKGVPTAAASALTGTNSTPGAATEAPGSAADAPKVPDAQLTPPGGGTFTAQQKKYLSGRVPHGTDPVAVLEGGQEICERLTRTAQIDRNAAAGAIVSGDISLDGASAAVRGLCPDQQGVIDAARHGFGDGTFTVAAKAVPGTSVTPGAYRAPNPSATCTWRVTGANGATLASGNTARSTVLTVPAAARGVTSSGCFAWLAFEGT